MAFGGGGMSIPENDDYSTVMCSECDEILECDARGDMPEICPGCGAWIDWSQWKDPCEEVEE
jgi:hypothetical protein